MYKKYIISGMLSYTKIVIVRWGWMHLQYLLLCYDVIYYCIPLTFLVRINDKFLMNMVFFRIIKKVAQTTKLTWMNIL